MAGQYQTVAVPFIQFGNRRGLTMQQFMENDWLVDLVRRFPAQFEYVPNTEILLLIEPEGQS